MKPATIIGILLIVLGIIGYATGGLSFTHEKKVLDAGSVQISHKTQDTLPPLADLQYSVADSWYRSGRGRDKSEVESWPRNSHQECRRDSRRPTLNTLLQVGAHKVDQVFSELGCERSVSIFQQVQPYMVF
jgi:hypothetical protein